MTNEQLFERLASHAGPAEVDAAFEDRLYSLLQSEIRRSERRTRPALLLVAALAALLMVSAVVVIGSVVIELPNPAPSSTPSPTAGPTAPSSPQAAWVTRMPGTRSSPAGVYGTVVTPTTTRWMHFVVEGPGGPSDPNVHETEIMFVASDDCFAGADGPAPVSATVAGLDGLYVEPYDDPSVYSGSPADNMTTGAYALPVGDQTLCVYLSWNPAATSEELDAARQVVESIRARQVQSATDGIQIEFTLPDGWDTG